MSRVRPIPIRLTVACALPALVVCLGAAAAVPGVTLADVAALSQPDGWSSSATRGPGTPGRHHQVGMEVDFVVPPGAQTASGGGSMTAAEQRLFDIVSQLRTAGQSSHQLKLTEVSLSNTKVVAAIVAAGWAGVTANTNTESAGVMHVGFAAPVPGVLSATEKSFLTDTLDGLVDLGAGLIADSRLQWAIPLALQDPGGDDPLVAKTLADVLGLGTMIHDGIYQPIYDWLTATPSPTLSGLVSQVAGLTGFSSVTEGAGNTAERVSFTFHYAKQRTTSLEMDLGTAASDAGILLAAPPTIGVAASMAFDVTVGVDLSRGGTASQAGFVQISNFHVGADVTATSLTFGANVGFLGAQVQNGHFTLHADLAAAVAGGAETSLGTLAATPVGTLVSLTPAGSVDLVLPLQASLGGWSTPVGPGQPKIAISDTNLFDGPGSSFSFNPVVDLALPSVEGFGQVSSASMVGLFGQLGSWLGNFQASSILSTPIPFTSGKTLGNILGLDATLIDNVISHLESEPNKPAFASAQALATLLPGIITGTQFDPAYA
ncbi:MAG: hypothetical protein NTU94_08280, partial [Planctomycetota bacterium]|nr:hypothetical protein [Planctomycetota bacterium]